MLKQKLQNDSESIAIFLMFASTNSSRSGLSTKNAEFSAQMEFLAQYTLLNIRWRGIYAASLKRRVQKSEGRRFASIS